MSTLLVAFNAHRRRASYSKAPCRFNIIVNVSAPSTSDFTNDVWSPNIYGELSHGGIDYTPSANGAFEHDMPLTATVYYWGGSGGSANAGFSFEASRYNEIYAGDQMQVSALVCLPCIKF